METLKSKLKVVWAVAAAVVILLGGLAAKDALAHSAYRYTGFIYKGCPGPAAAGANTLQMLRKAGAMWYIDVQNNHMGCMRL